VIDCSLTSLNPKNPLGRAFRINSMDISARSLEPLPHDIPGTPLQQNQSNGEQAADFAYRSGRLSIGRLRDM
jgi:hypothetical protein